MLVAVTIFTLVIGAITGLFISAIRSQGKVLTIQKLLDEASYTMEYMSRFLRMAKKDETGDCVKCNTSPPLPGYNYSYGPMDSPSWISFIDYHGQCRQFGVKGGERTKMAEWIYDEDPFVSDNICSAFFATDYPNNDLTSDDFEMPSSPTIFKISGEWEEDNFQPRVTFILRLQKYSKLKPDIVIQTTISQRNLDFK